MMPPQNVERRPNHLRSISVATYECPDGSIDIEMSLKDEKTFGFSDRERGRLEPGDPIHEMHTRVKIDPTMTVLSIQNNLAAMPFKLCQAAGDNVDQLIGKRLDLGWRTAVREALGATRGCTHLGELLLLAPTVAFQTRAISRSEENASLADLDFTQQVVPFFVGGCFSWAADSAVTKTYFPQFVKGSSDVTD